MAFENIVIQATADYNNIILIPTKCILYNIIFIVSNITYSMRNV